MQWVPVNCCVRSVRRKPDSRKGVCCAAPRSPEISGGAHFPGEEQKKKGNKIKVKNAMNMSNVLLYVGEQHSDEPGWAGSCWWFVQLDRGRCIPPAKVRWTGGLEEDLGLQLWSQVVPCSWNLQKGASIDALSFPRRIPEPAAPTAGRADRDPFHRVCGRKTMNIMWEKKKNSPSIDATST